MEEQNVVLEISDIQDLQHLCRICLNPSVEMIDMQCTLLGEHINVYDALCKVVSIKIATDAVYPPNICVECYSSLNVAYKILTQFENSNKLLEQYFQLSGIEINTNKKGSENSTASVELITPVGRFDLKNITVFKREEKKEQQVFSGFLKNLGKEISAVFVNKDAKKLKPNISDASISIEKHCNKTEMIYTTYKPREKKKPATADDLKCNICSRQFTKICYLQRHQATMHAPLPKFLCPHCGHQSKSIPAFNHHMNKHLGRKFKCHICSKTFTSLSARGCHVKVHEKGSQHLCEECGKSFNYAYGLRQHMRTWHQGYDKPHQCNVCEKKFWTSQKLIGHMQQHTGERMFRCKHCGKGYALKRSLKTHLMKMHPSVENL